MKFLYVKSTGEIIDWKVDNFEVGGLNPSIGIAQSDLATGAETNISEISDMIGKRETRPIDGSKISESTLSVLRNGTTDEKVAKLVEILLGSDNV